MILYVQFMNKLTNLNFFLVWVFGFFVLLSFDLFVEGFVFEWLEWNGTNKNDWFFVLWWGLVVIWFLNGSISLYQRLKKYEYKNCYIQNKSTTVE